mmetsp:Transcript_64127/g.93896  ORF Transcript_64127/g.93896 Transcript_64127/m.93896 type:complete len:208 (+) Transcript_64127:83-706(+)
MATLLTATCDPPKIHPDGSRENRVARGGFAPPSCATLPLSNLPSKISARVLARTRERGTLCSQHQIRELLGTACKTILMVLHVGAVLEQSTEGLRSEDAGHVCLETVGTIKFLRLVGHIDLVRYNSPVEPVDELLSTSTVTLGAKKGIDLGKLCAKFVLGNFVVEFLVGVLVIAVNVDKDGIDHLVRQLAAAEAAEEVDGGLEDDAI